MENANNSNDFLTKLFEKVNDNITKEIEYFEIQKEEYEKVINEIAPIIEKMTYENVDEVMNAIKNAKHILTSEKELKHKFKLNLYKL